MLQTRRDMSILLTAHWPELDTQTCPISREILAKGTSDIHTLLCAVDSFKMFQIHTICEDTDVISWLLCVLREMADVSKPLFMSPSSGPRTVPGTNWSPLPCYAYKALRHSILGVVGDGTPGLAMPTWPTTTAPVLQCSLSSFQFARGCV